MVVVVLFKKSYAIFVHRSTKLFNIIDHIAILKGVFEPSWIQKIQKIMAAAMFWTFCIRKSDIYHKKYRTFQTILPKAKKFILIHDLDCHNKT